MHQMRKPTRRRKLKRKLRGLRTAFIRRIQRFVLRIAHGIGAAGRFIVRLVIKSYVLITGRERLSPDERKQMQVRDNRGNLTVPPCIHCGGWHIIKCPRVRLIEYSPDGVRMTKVEFWHRWSKRHIIWPDEVWRETKEGQ